MLVKELVESANINTNEWKGVGDTYRNSQWSFGGKGEPTLLFIWWKNLVESSNGEISLTTNMLDYANSLRRNRVKNLGLKALRAEEFNGRCLTAYANKSPVKVALLLGQVFDDENTPDRVEARTLDTESWYVSSYDEPKNKFIIIRGLNTSENNIYEVSDESSRSIEIGFPAITSYPPAREKTGTTNSAKLQLHPAGKH